MTSRPLPEGEESRARCACRLRRLSSPTSAISMWRWDRSATSGRCRMGGGASSRFSAERCGGRGSRPRSCRAVRTGSTCAATASWSWWRATRFGRATASRSPSPTAALRRASPEIMERMSRGEPVDPALVYFRTVPTFEAPAGHLRLAQPQRLRGDGRAACRIRCRSRCSRCCSSGHGWRRRRSRLTTDHRGNCCEASICPNLAVGVRCDFAAAIPRPTRGTP